MISGPSVSGDAGADPLRQRPGPGREQQHQQGHRQRGGAGLDRGVAERDLEEGDEQEEEAAERRVDDEGDAVGGAELARAEDLQRQHRVGAAALVDEEGDEGEDAAGRSDEDRRRGAPFRRLDQRVGGAGEAERRQHGAAEVEAATGGDRVAALGHVPGRRPGDEGADRQVDQEDRPPGDRPDQVAAEQRPDRRRDPAQPRPGADRAGAVAGPEAGLDDRQAARGQQRPADPLQQPGEDQHLGVGGDRAEQRGEGEEADAEDEDPPPPVAVAERAAEQDQRGQGQQVAVEDPLQGAGAGAEVAADVGQGDVDDGAVEEGHPRAGDGRPPSSQRPPELSKSRPEPRLDRLRPQAHRSSSGGSACGPSGYISRSCSSLISRVLVMASAGAPTTSQSWSAVGVVEELAHRARLDQQRVQRRQGQRLAAVDPHPAAALEQHVELLLGEVAVLGRGLPGRQAPQPRPQLARLELLAEVGVLTDIWFEGRQKASAARSRR